MPCDAPYNTLFIVAIDYNTYLFTVTPLESVNTSIKTRQTNFRCNNEFVNIIMHFNFVYNYLFKKTSNPL